jgi:hypothetical protein
MKKQYIKPNIERVAIYDTTGVVIFSHGKTPLCLKNLNNGDNND